MKLNKLTEKELLDIINNSTDIKLIDAAETEWIKRFSPVELDNYEDDIPYIIEDVDSYV